MENKIITMDDLRNAGTDELIRLYDAVKGRTKDFKELTGAEFSYSTLTREIEKRSAEEQGVKVLYVKSDTTSRKTYTVNDSTANRWETFVEKSGLTNRMLLSLAMEHFMEDSREGRIEVKVNFN